MKKILSILLLMVATGCGKHKGIVEPELQPFVDEFSRQFGQTVNWMDVKFNPLDGDTVGECYYGNGEKPAHIEIDPDFWRDEDTNDGEREVLIMHELGHCVLDRDHVEGLIFDQGEQIQKSVMYPFVLNGPSYLRHKAYYMKELFNR